MGDSDLESFLGEQAARRQLLREAAASRKKKSPALLEAERMMAELERLVLRRHKGMSCPPKSGPGGIGVLTA
jgi:hypothetical protein